MLSPKILDFFIFPTSSPFYPSPSPSVYSPHMSELRIYLSEMVCKSNPLN